MVEVTDVVVGLFVLAFVVLIGLAVRRMARGELHAGKTPEALAPGEGLSPAEEEALAAEAEGQPERAVAKGPDHAETVAAEPAPAPMRQGLEKTRKGFMAKLNELLGRGGLDEALVDELEALMVTSDIGIRTTERLLGDLRQQLSKKEIKDPAAVRGRLREQILEIVAKPRSELKWEHTPTVMMVIGVNGVGKTTTIGKLAARLTREGKKVVLGAGDTFRAAAVQQLEVWGERAGAEVIKGPDNADPASVIFEAVAHAQRIGAHACICDTAGRLHTKVNLMEELKKVRRVMHKAVPGAPHEVMLVLDATTGQNAINQARQFKEAVEVSSLALTKLDGTAKGGVVVAICEELELPVRFVGIGEKVDDLRDFDAHEFVDALFEPDEGGLQRAG